MPPSDGGLEEYEEQFLPRCAWWVKLSRLRPMGLLGRIRLVLLGWGLALVAGFPALRAALLYL